MAKSTDSKPESTTDSPVAFPSNIPAVESPLAALPNPEPVPALADYKDLYVKEDDGEVYAVAKLTEARDDKTVFAMNQVHFWNGTESEFRLGFTAKK